MTHPVILIGAWVVLAFAMAAVPSTDNHWRRAYILLTIGLPLLVWITWVHGIAWGVLGLLVGGSVLRWPVYFLWKWLKRKVTK